MRKHFRHERVCTCSPERGMVYMEARMIRDIVNRGIHPIRCASTCAHMAQKGLLLGSLCEESSHLIWAWKIWKFTLERIHSKDYDDWIDVAFNTEHVRLRDVISDGACEIIGRRIDRVERRLGLSDAHGRDSWEYRAGDGWYNYLFYEKYDADWSSLLDELNEQRDEARASQHTAHLFSEAQNEHVAQPQDFFDYWNDYTPVLQEDLNFRIDDWG